MADGADRRSEHEAYAEIAELAGGFIHELKNHLGTFGLNLQLLAEDFQDPQTQPQRRALKRIESLQTQCQRLVDLANDFLRYARLTDLQFLPTDLTTIIEEMLDFFGPAARQANITIRPFISADLPLVGLDRDLFRQAFLNLLLNAREAMPGGGELTIQAIREGDDVALSLIDTGKGMTPEVLSRIFKPFFSTNPGGTGLGLPTTRKIIKAHGGTLEVQSEVGRGSKFTIRLPPYNPAEESQKA
jgi:signal transduction histidine kinase